MFGFNLSYLFGNHEPLDSVIEIHYIGHIENLIMFTI